MKRKLIALLIGLLALSGIVGIGLAQAGDDGANQSVEQEDDDGREDDSSGTDDGDEAGDDDGPGEAEDD
jgi:hypothetical protein